MTSAGICRCAGKVDKMELSVLLQMTFPGMPCVFYGDEKGLCGVSESEYRQAMAWGKSHPLEDVYRRLIALREGTSRPAVRRFRDEFRGREDLQLQPELGEHKDHSHHESGRRTHSRTANRQIALEKRRQS